MRYAKRRPGARQRRGRTSAGTGLQADFALYSDVPSSITSVNGIVSAWGLATQATPSARPSTEADTTTSNTFVRTAPGKTLVVPSGTLDFASQGAVTFAIAARQLTYAQTSNYVFLDTTNGGTSAGIQISVRDSAVSTWGRQVFARVFDGATWIVDYSDVGPSQAYLPLIWGVIIIGVTSTSLTVYVDGFLWLYISFAAVTFSASAASAAVLGNWPVDILAFEVWRGGLNTAAVSATTARLQSRFSLPYNPILLWHDDHNGECDPAACTLADNTYLAVTEADPSGVNNHSVIQSRYSSDGIAWTPDPGPDGLNAGLTLPFHPANGSWSIEGHVTQLSNGEVLALSSQTDGLLVRSLRAASPAAARANVWTNETVITQGSPGLEICSTNAVERPGHPGEVYVCVYRGPFAGPWDGYYYKSTDYGVTWAAPVKFANATTDGVGGTGYAEPGLQFVTAAAAAEYSDLTAGDFFFFIRADADLTMYEITSTNGVTFTRRATSLTTFASARFRFTSDGTMVPLLRDSRTGWDCLWRRTGVSGGIAQYTAVPMSPAVNPSFGDVVNGMNLGQYGDVCAEVTAGVPLIVSANRLGTFKCETYARFFPISQLYGRLTIVVSPATVVGTKNPGDTIQFSARGAGEYVWSMPANAPGCSIGSSTGLLTVGTLGGVVTVRCTDRNGYFDPLQDVSISCNAAANAFPDAANLVAHHDASSAAFVTDESGNKPAVGTKASAVDNQNGAATALVQATSGKQPSYGSATQNGLKVLDCTSGAAFMTCTLPGVASFTTFSDFTFVMAFGTGVSVSGTQTFGGYAAIGIMIRIDAGVVRVADWTGGAVLTSIFTDLTVAPSTAHVLVVRRTGTTVEAWLDGVKSSVTGTGYASPIFTTWPIANDDPATVFGEQFPGYVFEWGLYGISETAGNVTTASANLKAKWNTI